MPDEKGEITDLDVIMKVLDIIQKRMEAQPPRNDDVVQISRIFNNFLPGAVSGDLTQVGTALNEGAVTMGDTYKVKKNYGAVGKNAKVSLMPLGGGEAEARQFDTIELIEELTELRSEMRSRAKGTDEDIAVVAVGQAIETIQKGDSSGAEAHLKSAGKWAWTLATSIGAGVAAGALKTVLGL